MAATASPAPFSGGGDRGLQDRILSHMNQSHARELRHYLRHYCGLTRRQACGASLRDITLQGMRIRAGGADYVVQFNPPLQSWNDVRPRVVEMDAIARKHLGISDVYVTRYRGPGFAQGVVVAGVALYFFCLASLPWVVPGSRIWTLLLAHFPGGPESFRWLVKTLVLPVIGAHTLEPIYLDYSRLRKHGVDRWSGQWWLWIVSCVFEGALVFRRFDKVVAEMRARKEAKKH
ncbi:uncharacterized protein UV8b_00637 [Ustilaginoidea virens]|uniref:DUF2470 domain-containing protein n=1 Tax=Ustilaginoidea virens TaxID=1159556 RepID=A0A1B5KRI8_USTVR|nr:uncharacterized protein UV8b_00637 [Ustilaginoidea virens]QUC16396.1 hypothetical protein UV8b_00637 [Ustilaginoidea virens]GAO13383.1 hypothetical protein UVI_02013920 [Ustilaginoidea virens]